MQIPELRRLQDILSSFLGAPKNDVTDDGQLQFNCPRCMDEKGPSEAGKFNLEVNVLKGVFMCWSCCTIDDDMRGSVRKLIMKFSGRETLKQYEQVVNDIRPQSVMIYTIDRETPDHNLLKATHEELDAIKQRVEALGIPCTASY